MRLGGEAGATLQTATLEHEATSVGTIALHEAMLDFALALVWLVSAFWHDIIL